MTELILGALAMLAFVLLVNHARKNTLGVKFWQWIITALGIVYVVFVLEVILTFMAEGQPQAAVVTGSLMAVLAVVWCVVVARLFFGKNQSNA